MAVPLPQVYTLTASGDYQLTLAGNSAGPDGWNIQFIGASWTGSIVLKSNQAPPGAANNLVSVTYYSLNTYLPVTAGTAITVATVPYFVRDTAYDLYAVYTHTAGTVTLVVTPANNASGGGPGPSPGTVPAGDVTSGTFGAFSGDTGTYVFPSQLNFGTKLVSTTALATPSALAATALNAFASTVSGAALMGFGTTYDVALKNRAGTDAVGVQANSTIVDFAAQVGIGTAGVSTTGLLVGGTVTASAGNARSARSASTLVAAANADVLQSLQVTPLFTPGAFTGLVARGINIGAFSTAAFTSPAEPAAIQFAAVTGKAGADASGIIMGITTGGDINYLMRASTASVFNVLASGAITTASTALIGGLATLTGGATSVASYASLSATAVPATAGAVAAGSVIRMYSNLLTLEATTDAPTHTRPKGSLCININGSSIATRLYVNTDGGTTWANFVTSA